MLISTCLLYCNSTNEFGWAHDAILVQIPIQFGKDLPTKASLDIAFSWFAVPRIHWVDYRGELSAAFFIDATCINPRKNQTHR